MKVTALIMAGGRGERFWPRSRISLPKQFLTITDEQKTMIQLTVERVSQVVDCSDIFILTNKAYTNLSKEQVCNSVYKIPEKNILFEPCSRNTAPAIALGACHISARYGDAVMVVLPSDSMVMQNECFADVLRRAIYVAQNKNAIVTVGIKPTSPETGYGYIQYDNDDGKDGKNGAVDKDDCTNLGVHKVSRYVEKPNAQKAQEYIDEGNFLWNSGQFIMKASVLLKEMQKYTPEIASSMQTVQKVIDTKEYESVVEEVFPLLPSISIDYAVMEKVDCMYTALGTFGWDDVGSWNALKRIKHVDGKENASSGNAVMLNCNNCIIEGKEKLIAAIGLNDIIVVDTDDVLLLCKRDQAENIKKVLEILKQEKREQYL